VARTVSVNSGQVVGGGISIAAAADVFAPEADDPGFAIPIPRALRARRTRSQHSSPEPGFRCRPRLQAYGPRSCCFSARCHTRPIPQRRVHFGPEALRANDNAAASIE
jgi:hypothetical protein